MNLHVFIAWKNKLIYDVNIYIYNIDNKYLLILEPNK